MVYFPNKEEWGLLYWGGAACIILNQKNSTRMKKIHPMFKKFFVNEFGIFERDSETEYRHNKQLVSFYNSHDDILTFEQVKKIETLYQMAEDDELLDYLKEIKPEIIPRNPRTVQDAMHHIAEIDSHMAIDIDTDKFLPFFEAYNPKAVKAAEDARRRAKDEIDNMNPPLPKGVMPFAYIAGGVMLLAIVMQNAPSYLREFAEWWEQKFGGFIFSIPLPS